MVKLEMTTVIGCKNMCSYCPQAATIRNYGSRDRVMSLTTFKKCVDKSPSKAEIAFSGFAEPLLNPQCIDMIEYAYEKHHPVSLYTTLVGASLEDIKRLGKIRFRDFVLHLPDKGMCLEVNEEYLNKLREVIKLNISATNEKYAVCFGETDKSVKVAIGTNLPILDQSIPHTRAGNVKTNDIRRKGLITCRRGGNALDQNIILPDGTVVLCCMDFGLNHVLGNLLTQSYEEIMNSPAKKSIRAGFTDEKSNILCRTCESAVSLSGDGLMGAFLYLNSRKKEIV